MKIVNIVPGFGGTFYCGNCLRDSGYTKSLIEMGHDAIMVPIYLPLTFEHGVEKSETPIFYGAVNIYLKQNFKLFKKMPKWIEKFFNSMFLLRFAAKKAGSTRTEGLEEMTISMLNGKDGNQQKELQELIDYLKYHEKPDIVHLSNALLMGLAKEIKLQLNIPVVCSLQDEDVWVDAMNDFYQKKMWTLMSEKAKDIDMFIAVSKYYADEMKRKMNISEEKMRIVHIGIDETLYKPSKPADNPQVIGYLSRMYKEHGFGVLIDAFIKLKKNPKFSSVLLKLSGGYTADDKKYVNEQIKKLKNAGIFNDVEFINEFAIPERSNFFKQITLLSVPVLKGEAFGTYQIEALACGVPLVQPALGAFTEIVETSKAGAVYFPNTADNLADKWAEVLIDKDKLLTMSENGILAVKNFYTNKVLTKEILKIYEEIAKLSDV